MATDLSHGSPRRPKERPEKRRTRGGLGTQNILDVRSCPDFSKVCF